MVSGVPAGLMGCRGGPRDRHRALRAAGSVPGFALVGGAACSRAPLCRFGCRGHPLLPADQLTLRAVAAMVFGPPFRGLSPRPGLSVGAGFVLVAVPRSLWAEASRPWVDHLHRL